MALTRPGDLRGVAAGSADVRRAVTLIIEDVNKLPHRGTTFDWALIQAFDPVEAAKIRDKFQQDEYHLLNEILSEKLSSASTSKAMDAYWSIQMAGKPDEATALLRRYAEKKVPLPFDP